MRLHQYHLPIVLRLVLVHRTDQGGNITPWKIAEPSEVETPFGVAGSLVELKLTRLELAC